MRSSVTSSAVALADRTRLNWGKGVGRHFPEEEGGLLQSLRAQNRVNNCLLWAFRAFSVPRTGAQAILAMGPTRVRVGSWVPCPGRHRSPGWGRSRPKDPARTERPPRGQGMSAAASAPLPAREGSSGLPEGKAHDARLRTTKWRGTGRTRHAPVRWGGYDENKDQARRFHQVHHQVQEMPDVSNTVWCWFQEVCQPLPRNIIHSIWPAVPFRWQTYDFIPTLP